MRALWFLAMLALLALAPLSSDAQWSGIWKTPGGAGTVSCTVQITGGTVSVGPGGYSVTC